ncbi:hypothetical protein [Nocardia sp. NPDC050710]|uniref:hypothetical protein n=1 Tax=Nocardia sp. NPDC050710 TaxID=3157220 RepID=UPI0033D376DA
MTRSAPQTLSTTTLLDIDGDPVLRAAGPVTGSISLRYGCSDPPTRAWFLRVQLAPTIPDTASGDTAHTAALTIDGTTVYGGSAYLWLSVGRRAPRTGADLPDATPRDLVTDPWSTAPGSLPAAGIAALHGLYDLILTAWHTPQRWSSAQLACPPQTTPSGDNAGDRLAAIHTLSRPPQ